MKLSMILSLRAMSSPWIFHVMILSLLSVSTYVMARPVRVVSLRLLEEGSPPGGSYLSGVPGRTLKQALTTRAELLTDATLAELIPPTLDLSACGAQCPEVIGRAVGADFVTHGRLLTFGKGLRARILISEVSSGKILIDELFAAPSPETLEAAILSKSQPWILALSSAIVQAESRPLSFSNPKEKAHAQTARWSSLGIEWIALKGGRFNMGNPKGPAKERPVHGVELSPFSLMKTEVTAAQYHHCVEAGACTRPKEGQGCVTLTAHSARPINCVSWKQAREFAEWIGARLPTEIEWAYAAQGDQARSHPWGEARVDCSRAVILGNAQNADETDQGEGCGEGEPHVVCSRPQGNSPEGLCDLVGNLWEWVMDDWHPDYKNAPTKGSWCLDRTCAPQPRGAKTYRGGGWYHEGEAVSGTSRGFGDPDFQGVGIGFRCAL